MSRKRKETRIQATYKFLVGFGILAGLLVGVSAIADKREDSEKEAVRMASQFATQLAQSLRENEDFRDALAHSDGCEAEIAGLIAAQAALDQAQHEYDVAYQTLANCLHSPPNPQPGPELQPNQGPPSPESFPFHTEFSVLVP